MGVGQVVRAQVDGVEMDVVVEVEEVVGGVEIAVGEVEAFQHFAVS